MARLSFSTVVTPDMAGVEAIRAAREYGYQGVDLRVSDSKGELTVESTSEEIAALRRAFDSEGILPASLFCHNDAGSADDGSWEKMELSILRHMEIAERLGDPAIRIFGGNILGYDSVEAFIDRTAETLHRVFEKTPSGINVLLQNHAGSYNFMQSAALVRKLGSPRFRLAFSPDHVWVMGENWNEVLAAAGEVSGQFYVSDVEAPREDDTETKHRAVLPGRGVIPLREAYQAVGGGAFTGWVSLKYEKVWHPEFEEPEVSLPGFIEYFRDELA